MSNVLRGYVPTVEFKYASGGAQTIATYLTTSGQSQCVLWVPVASQLNYRKVWCFFWTTSITSISSDLVGFLGGREVFRHPWARYSTGSNNSWYGGFALAANAVGGEIIVHTISGAGTYVISPWRLNLTCDSLGIEVLTAAPVGATLWDGFLGVQSMIGI